LKEFVRLSPFHVPTRLPLCPSCAGLKKRKSPFDFLQAYQLKDVNKTISENVRFVNGCAVRAPIPRTSHRVRKERKRKASPYLKSENERRKREFRNTSVYGKGNHVNLLNPVFLEDQAALMSGGPGREDIVEEDAGLRQGKCPLSDADFSL
jgi:hypothetical protein